MLTVLNTQRSTLRHLFHKLLTQSHHILGTQRHTADTIQLIIMVTYTTSTPNENAYQTIGHPQTNQTNGQLTLSPIQRMKRKKKTILELTLPTSRSMHQGRRRWRSDNNFLCPFRWRHTNVGRPIRLSIPQTYNNNNKSFVHLAHIPEIYHQKRIYQRVFLLAGDLSHLLETHYHYLQQQHAYSDQQ